MANLKEQMEAFKQGRIIDSEGNEDTRCFNFYDWFCSDRALQGKAKSLYGQLKTFLKYHPEINQETTYCWFKNNCPCFGRLYDDFRISDIETGNVIYTVIPKTGHESETRKGHVAQVWGIENDFKEALKTALTYSQLFK